MSAEPLSVEYAKSSKSVCKDCKKSIAKGELRVGFVGKANFGATAWFHYDCIWNDYKNLKTVDYTKPIESLIQGFSEIKDEDQKKLKTDLPKYCAIAVKKGEEPAAPKLPMAAEYAKSAKSSCKGCSKSIDKCVLRLGLTGKANFGATAWYHPDCLADLSKENFTGINASESIKNIVEGFSKLEEDDQTKVEKTIRNVIGKGTPKGKHDLQNKESEESSPAKKKK